MPRAVFVVFTNPMSPELEDDYNELYDNTHVPEVCATPGFISGRRYRVSDSRPPLGPVADYKYLTIYEIESDDLHATFEALKAAAPDMTPTNTVIARNGTYGVFEEHVPKG